MHHAIPYGRRSHDPHISCDCSTGLGSPARQELHPTVLRSAPAADLATCHLASGWGFRLPLMSGMER